MIDDFDPTVILDRLGDDLMHLLQTTASVLMFGIWCEVFARVFLG